MFHSSGRWFFGSQRWLLSRNEYTRSFARDFSSSRRAPPNAASNLYLFSACFKEAVFMMSVCFALPWLNGPTPASTPSWLICTNRSKPCFSACWSRNSIISWNFHVVSTCNKGKGILPGAKALRARCNSTEESFPTEYNMTGLSNSAATSRKMWMLSASSCFKWVIDGISSVIFESDS